MKQIGKALCAMGGESGSNSSHVYFVRFYWVKVNANLAVTLLYIKSKWKRVQNIPVNMIQSGFQATGHQNEDRKAEERDRKKSPLM